MLRAVGIAFVFLATVAPLPGEAPSCSPWSEYTDQSPAISGGMLEVACTARCDAECEALQECGRVGPDPRELSNCTAECSAKRGCAGVTVDRVCQGFPDDPGDPNDMVVTERERDACAEAPVAIPPPDCWCNEGTLGDCWLPTFPAGRDPWECQSKQLCDPRE